MKRKYFYIPLLIIIFIPVIFSFRKPKQQIRRDYVPDAETAKKIAEAILLPIFGKNQIEGEKPFTATLIGDSIWYVYGTLPERYEVGGVAEIKISKKDCRILEVIHGK